MPGEAQPDAVPGPAARRKPLAFQPGNVPSRSAPRQPQQAGRPPAGEETLENVLRLGAVALTARAAFHEGRRKQQLRSRPVEGRQGLAALPFRGRFAMTMLKVVEVLAESPNGWEEAAQNAVKQAAETVRGVSSIYVKEFEAKVENDRITSYRINAKITFTLEGRP